MSNAPLDPEFIEQQTNRALEETTAREGLTAIDDLKKAKKGYAYLQRRLQEKAADFHNEAIEGETPEKREMARLIYKKFKEEIIPMIEIDEENHRQTLGEKSSY